MPSDAHNYFRQPTAKTLHHRKCVVLAVLLTWAVTLHTQAEIVFQDFFSQPAGNITNSVPWINVQGGGWQTGAGPSELTLDGNGHIYNGASNAAAAGGVPLVSIGPHGIFTASVTLQLPAGSPESIDMGYCDTNKFLTDGTSGSGPWVQVFGNGNINFYGGTSVGNEHSLTNAYANDGTPFQIFLKYDAFHVRASVGTVIGGVTNVLLNNWPVTNYAGRVVPRYLVFQLSTNLTTPTARWMTAATVDWIPRPPPLLALPVPVVATNFVGPPGTNDIQLIQNAFHLNANSAIPTEIRFTAGATYVISDSSVTAEVPNQLFHATNVLLNGNGCKILITNPRIGFLSLNGCSNVIVEGFSVDYDPLPFTQGVVTHNFYTGGDVPAEPAIEFQVDAGYPAPTNANYIDAEAITTAGRLGMVMDTNHPGRVAPGAWSSCVYTNVVQTNSNGAFKVYLSSPVQSATIQPGDVWWMESRWNGSTVFETFESSQVTFLNDTNFAAAGLSYLGLYSPMVSEVGDQIQFGPPPAGGSEPRLRTSNADGGLFIESRIGPWVQGCDFVGLSDDSANACVYPFIVTNTVGGPTNTFALYSNTQLGGTPVGLLPFQVLEGDSFLFFNPANGVVFDRATVTAVSLPDVTFDHPITNVVPGTFDTNTLLVDQTLNTSAVYLDNVFTDSGFKGIYCRANNMLVAHNTLGGFGHNPLVGFPYIVSSFINFFVPTNLVIMNNILYDGGYSYESIHNTDPSEEPLYALLAMYKATPTTFYVSDGYEISGLRILGNAFLTWRRAPLVLRNTSDAIIAGNYFGPPVTNDGLVPLSADAAASLWAVDNSSVSFTNNVNATTLADNETVTENGAAVSVTGGFQQASAPQLTLNIAGESAVVSWVSPSPGFVLQQAGELGEGTNNWSDTMTDVSIAGTSNFVTLPYVPGSNVFYRTRQR